MLLCITDLLDTDELQTARQALAEARFVDGRATAGLQARLVKDNLQADPKDASLDALRRHLHAKILAHPLVRLAARPRTLTPLILSRYEPGMAYGTHVDDALMNGMRTDLSLTLFLAEPDSYVGGELVIETAAGEQAFKLPAGAMILYPTTVLHRVGPVEVGARLAAVGWIRSFVRDAAAREILFDLDTAKELVFQARGKCQAFDLLAKSSTNLLRRWVED